MGLYRRHESKVWWMSYMKDGQQCRESSGSTNKKLAEKLLASRTAQVFEERWSLHLISNSLFRRLSTSSPARRHDMVRTFLIALTICLTLTSCYTPNQEALVETVHKRVTVGMPISQAISALSKDGFDCSGSVPVDCVRTRQRLLPSTCIERVRLQHKLWTVDTIDIAPIACAGL